MALVRAVMAASMAVGVLTVLVSAEPAMRALPQPRNAAEWLQGVLIAPFADFIGRYKWQAALILSLIAVAPIALGLLIYAYRTVPQAEATIAERAASAAA